MVENLSRWKPKWSTTYAGYKQGDKHDEPAKSGKVVIHTGDGEYVGGFYIHKSGSVKIWYKDGFLDKVIYVPFYLCMFTKQSDGKRNIYDVIIHDNKIGVKMTGDNKPEPISPKDAASVWERLFHTRDLKEWTEIFQSELDTRWKTFDTNLENLSKEWKTFKKTQMEITEAYDNVIVCQKEWKESLTSLGNLINKKTTHEKGMWGITQSNRQNRDIKVKQRMIRTSVDEMNFNSMMDYIKQYPELQSSNIIGKSADKTDEKRKEVLDAEKLYHQKEKEVNTYLNTAKSDLQRISNELLSFEEIKSKGTTKLEGELKKPINKIRIKLWWTPKEQQRLNLYLNESDRKIGESKGQLKLMEQDLRDYEKREFKPIVTKRFTAIED